MCLVGLLFTARYVPETRGRTVDEVQGALARRFGRPAPAAAATGG